MTILVLAESWDLGAAAVANAVAARRGPRSVAVLTPRRLALARRWVHTISPRGAVATEIVTADGLQIDIVDAVLNRVDGIPPLRFTRSTPRDRDYAAMELQALLVSWLASLPGPVVNPVTGNGPAQSLPRMRWLLEAHRAGLPVVRTGHATSARAAAAANHEPAAARSPAGEVLVVGQRAHGPLAGRFGDGCVEVARATGCPLLAFRFVRVDNAVEVAEVDPRPDLLDPASITEVADYLAEVAS